MKRRQGREIVHQYAKQCALVIVEWVDSSYALGWLTSADDAEPKLKRCCSVGWLRQQTKDAITLTANMTMEESPHRCCEITIPRCAVQRIHKLKL